MRGRRRTECRVQRNSQLSKVIVFAGIDRDQMWRGSGSTKLLTQSHSNAIHAIDDYLQPGQGTCELTQEFAIGSNQQLRVDHQHVWHYPQSAVEYLIFRSDEPGHFQVTTIGNNIHQRAACSSVARGDQNTSGLCFCGCIHKRLETDRWKRSLAGATQAAIASDDS